MTVIWWQKPLLTIRYQIKLLGKIETKPRFISRNSHALFGKQACLGNENVQVQLSRPTENLKTRIHSETAEYVSISVSTLLLHYK